jgi:hypothetical protein
VILAPSAAHSIVAGEAALLRGSANDAEDGALNGASLTWTLDSHSLGSGAEQRAEGLAPGSYDVALTARDSTGQERTSHALLNISTLGIQQVDDPSLDGRCDDAAYANSTSLPMAPYSDGSQANARVVRGDNSLWVCIGGLTRGGNAGFRIDPNNSRDGLAQPDDYGFFVTENGGTYTLAGDGQGNFYSAGPGGLLAQVSVGSQVWSAELRVEASVLSGWGHLAGLQVSHIAPGDDYHSWPYLSRYPHPSTYGRAALGELPRIVELDPSDYTIGGPITSLSVVGENFVSGATVYFGEQALPTSFVSSTRLLGDLSAADLSAGRNVAVTVVNPTLSVVASNPAFFTINNPSPTIAGLTPASAKAGSGAFTLTVKGSNFVPGATVLWNGAERPTTFVSSTQLRAQIGAADLVMSRTVGVTVVNPDPGGVAANVVAFAVGGYRIFLPLVRR